MRWILPWIFLGACRDGSTPSPTPAPDHATPQRAGSAAGTPRPTLVVDEPGSAATIPDVPIDKTFETEAVDRFWKTNTEAEIRRRVPTANGIECHTTLCKLTFVGSERELRKVLDEIETERSLRGIAESIVLGAPEKRDDGTIAVRAFARFAHPEP
jgi:hypothetical protein